MNAKKGFCEHIPGLRRIWFMVSTHQYPVAVLKIAGSRDVDRCGGQKCRGSVVVTRQEVLPRHHPGV
jgi:hypothetical protein